MKSLTNVYIKNRTFKKEEKSYSYTLVKHERKTITLTIKKDKTIFLKCPTQTSEDRILDFLNKKVFWLEKNLQNVTKLFKKEIKKDYISGESFFYLGKQYKLVVEKSTENKVVLDKSILRIFTTKKLNDGKVNKELLSEWFLESVSKLANKLYKNACLNFNYKEYPELKIKYYKTKWGAYSTKGTIFLNPNLICFDKRCLEYVIYHELCHVKISDHSKKYYNFLDLKYADWIKIKEKLSDRNIDLFF